MVNFKPPHKPNTFEAYANICHPAIYQVPASKRSRDDIILDAYLENSLKSQTRV